LDIQEKCFEEHMKKKILSILTVLLVALIMTSSVSAGGNVGLSRVTFKLGSLTATGTLTGLGGYREGVTVNLAASGIPVVTCINPGGNQSPGQNPPKVNANGNQFIGPQGITKKGTAPMNVKAEPGPITGTQGGCPNDNWTARIDFIFWTSAMITVHDTATNTLLLTQNYSCTTTRDPDSVSCKLVK
jgi:hypothetical protein